MRRLPKDQWERVVKVLSERGGIPEFDGLKFGLEVRRRRSAMGIGRAVFADLVGVSQGTISYIEVGSPKKSCSLRTALRIAAVLGKPLEELAFQKSVPGRSSL